LDTIFQEAGLVRPGRMEHEMAEAQADIGADLLDMLVGIARHDPAARRAVERQRIGQALHLDRVLDRRLLLRRQGERCPMARVLLGAHGVGVEGDF
jgi:hypothetical protein